MNTAAHPPRRLRRGLLALVWAFGLSALAGCGGGTGSGSSEADSGELLLALTDAEGDFLTYTVDITALSLVRDNGAVVESLPRTTRLDFSQYVEVTELLTTATVPAGRYASARLTLDFSAAEITVQAEDGNALPASPVDAQGQPLGQVSLEVELNGESGFRVRPGVPALLTLDFDLEASNRVEILGDTATVTVEPFLVAETQPQASEEFRLRGLLGPVDPAAQVFVVELRPFRHRSGAFGSARVQVDAGTVFEVDGVPLDAEAGLAALAELDAAAPVVTLGSFDTASRQYTAAQVYAGTSVPWASRDILRGAVLARSGDTLTVHGATVQLRDGRFVFNDRVRVILGPQTTVTRQGDPDAALDSGAVSVGQAVTVLGTLTSEDTLDASDGLVRLRFTPLTGSVVGFSPLSVELQRLAGRSAGVYDFTGTGVDPANDADPRSYEIATGSLPLETLLAGDPVRVRGFVRAFGTAPEDFEARSVTDVSAVRTRLVVGYGAGGSDQAVASLSPEGLLLDIGEAGSRHHLVQAGIATDLADLPAVPLIVPGEGDGVFAIARGRRVEVYTRFADFAAALGDELALGARVSQVHASGGYDPGAGQLSSRHLRLRLAR